MAYANSSSQIAFGPKQSVTAKISASDTSANVQMTGTTEGQLTHIRVFNEAATTAYVVFGTSVSLTASASVDMPVPAGGVEVIRTDHAWAAAVLASGTGTVSFTPGDGL